MYSRTSAAPPTIHNVEPTPAAAVVGAVDDGPTRKKRKFMNYYLVLQNAPPLSVQ